MIERNGRRNKLLPPPFYSENPRVKKEFDPELWEEVNRKPSYHLGKHKKWRMHLLTQDRSKSQRETVVRSPWRTCRVQMHRETRLDRSNCTKINYL